MMAGYSDDLSTYLTGIGRISRIDQATEMEFGRLIQEGAEAQHTLNTDRSLTPAAQRRLRIQVKRGDDARQQFIKANLRLVVSEASRAHAGGMYRALELSDLIQEGNLGLIHAVEKYDWNAGTKFSTYATNWIRQAMSRGAANRGRAIRYPVYVVTARNRVLRVTQQLEAKLGRTPTLEEISEEADLTPETVQQIWDLPQASASLDAKYGEDDNMEMVDTIPDPDIDIETPAVDSIYYGALRDTIRESLSDREWDIVRLRFGFDGHRALTLEEVGEQMGISRERVRQIEAKMITKVREAHAGQFAVSA